MSDQSQRVGDPGSKVTGEQTPEQNRKECALQVSILNKEGTRGKSESERASGLTYSMVTRQAVD